VTIIVWEKSKELAVFTLHPFMVVVVLTTMRGHGHHLMIQVCLVVVYVLTLLPTGRTSSLDPTAVSPYKLPVSLRDVLSMPFYGTTKPFDPHFLLYHHTRYVKGCFTHLQPQNYSYSTIVPFLYNFDLLVTSCGIDWQDPKEIRSSTVCLYETNRRNIHIQDYLSDVYIHPEIIYVHVRAWKPALDLLLERILPNFSKEKRYVILHTGSEDLSIDYAVHGQRILKSKVVLRWVLEQNSHPVIASHPKVLQLPIGFCARELMDETGKELDQAMQHTLHNAPATLRRLAANAETVPFSERQERIFVCFHTGFTHRAKLMHYAKHNCTVCDICEHGALTHLQLWMKYTEYKYILAPLGNGVDCFRNFEIILLGAIPVMPYFEGTKGYVDAGLQVITFQHEKEINADSIRQWSMKFNRSTDRHLVTRQYWNERAFQWHGELPPFL
jgi:hypothetical protein